MTPIILHCFYDGNEIRGYAQSRPQGLINIRDKVPLSFVLCGGCYERLTAGITKVIVIFLVFHSTKKGLSLVDSWSTEPWLNLNIPIEAIQPLHPLGITAKARDQIMVEAVGWAKLRWKKTLGPYKLLRWPLVIWFPDLPRQIRQSWAREVRLGDSTWTISATMET